jgi:hypothetical protein
MPPRRRRTSKSDRRRSFELLASCPEGCSEAIMLTHGFTTAQMVELVRAGLASVSASGSLPAAPRLRSRGCGSRKQAGGHFVVKVDTGELGFGKTATTRQMRSLPQGPGGERLGPRFS